MCDYPHHHYLHLDSSNDSDRYHCKTPALALCLSFASFKTLLKQCMFVVVRFLFRSTWSAGDYQNMKRKASQKKRPRSQGDYQHETKSRKSARLAARQSKSDATVNDTSRAGNSSKKVIIPAATPIRLPSSQQSRSRNYGM